MSFYGKRKNKDTVVPNWLWSHAFQMTHIKPSQWTNPRHNMIRNNVYGLLSSPVWSRYSAVPSPRFGFCPWSCVGELGWVWGTHLTREAGSEDPPLPRIGQQLRRIRCYPCSRSGAAGPSIPNIPTQLERKRRQIMHDRTEQNKIEDVCTTLFAGKFILVVLYGKSGAMRIGIYGYWGSFRCNEDRNENNESTMSECRKISTFFGPSWTYYKKNTHLM